MARAKYKIKTNNGSGMYITLPTEIAFSLGIKDLRGNILISFVRYELGQDDTGTYAIIRPAYDDNGSV